MKKFWAFILIGFFCFFVVSALNIPAPREQYVNDFAGVLDVSEQAMLRGLFMQVEMNTTAQIVFVSLDSINGSDIASYALEIGRQWGVGQKDKNNGLVILYVKDIGKIYVSSGYGVEGILPDSKIGRILDENYVPYRDSGNISEGIVLSSVELSKVMFENADEIKSGNAGKSFNYSIFIEIAFWVILFFFILWIKARRIKKNRRRNDFPWWVLLFLPSGKNQSSGWGGGFSGGGGGFGGGSFGGGGAGR